MNSHEKFMKNSWITAIVYLVVGMILLITNPNDNAFSEISRFLGGIVCLGSILMMLGLVGLGRYDN